MISRQQTQTNKISRIIPYKTSINNAVDYHRFYKNALASSHVLQVEYLDTNYYHNNEGRDKMQQRLISLLRKAKPIKALRLHKCIVQYENISDPIVKQIAKKNSRTKSLSFPDYALSKEVIEKYTLWLKYTKGMKKFHYIAPPCADFPDGHVRNFDTTVEKFFQGFKRGRINSLDISHNISDDRIGNSFLKFNRYPSTLKSLTFDWRHYSTDSDASLPELTESLSHMRDLTSLSLNFRNQANLLGPILSSINNISQLTSLDIGFIDNGEQDVCLPFERLCRLQNLTSIKLKFDFWPKGIEAFLKSLESCPIKEFSLDAVIELDSQLLALKSLISYLKGLESLTLKIYKNSSFKTEGSLRELFEEISRVRPLKNLKLNFQTSSTEKFEQCPKIFQALKGVFAKSIKLERFSFQFNQMDANHTFLELISLVDRVAPALKKLKIDVGEFKPCDSDYTNIIKLVQRLHNIEVLKLNSLSISMNSMAQNFLNSVYHLRNLKSFEMKEIKGTLNKASFVHLIEKMLSKRGLEKFDCTLSWDTKDTLVRRTRSCYQIDLKQLVRKNPDLHIYPQSTPMYVYYDDDTEWKWSC